MVKILFHLQGSLVQGLQAIRCAIRRAFSRITSVEIAASSINFITSYRPALWLLREGRKLFRFRCAVYKAFSSPLLKIIYESSYIYRLCGTYGSCKRVPSRTTLSRESNREIDGLESIERGMNFASGKKGNGSFVGKIFLKIFNPGKISLILLFLLRCNLLIVGERNYISSRLREIFRQDGRFDCSTKLLKINIYIYLRYVNEVTKARKNVPFSTGVSAGAGHGA